MTTKTIGLVVAMAEERKHLFRGRMVEKGRAGEFPLFRMDAGDRRLVAVETGMGSARAAAGAEALLDAERVDLLVSIGFGGGVTDRLQPGEIVIAERLLRYRGGRLQESSRPPVCETDRFSLPPHRIGTVVTTDGVEPKASLAGKLPAEFRNCVVDMETWGVAEVAAARGMPLLAIRGISDGAGEEIRLPLEEITTGNGQVSIVRILLQVAKRPALVPHLLRLGRNAAAAGRNLSEVAEALLHPDSPSAHS